MACDHKMTHYFVNSVGIDGVVVPRTEKDICSFSVCRVCRQVSYADLATNTVYWYNDYNSETV